MFLFKDMFGWDCFILDFMDEMVPLYDWLRGTRPFLFTEQSSSVFIRVSTRRYSAMPTFSSVTAFDAYPIAQPSDNLSKASLQRSTVSTLMLLWRVPMNGNQLHRSSSLPLCKHANSNLFSRTKKP